jgi:hypothetical protein
MLRFAGAAGLTGAIVRQKSETQMKHRIRFDMRLSWHWSRGAQSPVRGGSINFHWTGHAGGVSR